MFAACEYAEFTRCIVKHIYETPLRRVQDIIAVAVCKGNETLVRVG